MPATFSAFQDIQQLVRCDRRDRPAGDATEQFKKPARLLKGGRRLSLPLYLLDIFIGDQLESGLRRQFRIELLLSLLLDRIEAVGELHACLLESYFGEVTKRQLPLQAV
ncbi:hypothetical protein A7X12_05650 [Sphingomonas sp. TDK1]|nr:hypothetical protein A7X12_05650 [Sphingomonas sp. TDK1]